MSRDFARQLRREMSDAERLLWKHLRAHRFAGEKFRRQEPIGPFIVDFVSHGSRLIIELDGGQHTTQVAYDEERSRWLNGRGYRVIRFWNNQVLTETQPVLESIALALGRPLSLTLPRKGEGTRAGVRSRGFESTERAKPRGTQPYRNQAQDRDPGDRV